MKKETGQPETPALETLRIPPGLKVIEEGKPFFIKGDNKAGCLLIHGFTGTTSSMLPMGEYLSSEGITVLAPRLPGHGTDVKDMSLYSYLDWVKTVEKALEELASLCERVFVAGLSMGGTLTLYLAEHHPEKIAGIVPICAPVTRIAPGIQQHALFLVPFLKHLLPYMPGPGNDLKDPDVKEIAYEKMSTVALHELVKLVKTVKKDIGRISAPARIFEAREDHVVPPENASYIYENISSSDKKLIWLENSYHVATLDYDKEIIFKETAELIRQYS